MNILPVVEDLQFEWIYRHFHLLLRTAPLVAPRYWQSLDISRHPTMVTRELQNAIMCWPMPPERPGAALQIAPNLPWAEDHFQERVSGQPLNPGEQYKNWPWYKGNVEQHQTQGAEKFSHTYMERFWPKKAGIIPVPDTPLEAYSPLAGIRFEYGDLNDVVEQLIKDPLTRQAYLPVWFPEDTGAVHGERVPCTLGYQFMIRNNNLNINYFIRSCDLLRHFRDDVYLAVRLAQWVSGQLLSHVHPHPQPGFITMFMGSLHVFEGDLPKMQKEAKEWANPGQFPTAPI